MNIRLTVLSVLILLVSVPVKVNSAIIDFEELPFPSALPVGSSLSTHGYTITNDGSIVAEVTPCNPSCANNGTQTLLTQVDGTLRITKSDGGGFNLIGFDAGESFSALNSFWAGQIDVTANLIGGNSIQISFSLDQINDGDGPLIDFQSFALPAAITNISSLVIKGSGGIGGRNDYSLDNIQLQAVPVLPAFWLFISGLLSLYGFRQTNVSRSV